MSDARGVRRSRGHEEEESYFISMADMMVGLLFVFLILLLYFALQFQQKSAALSNAGETRDRILTSIKDEIVRRDPTIRVEVDNNTGVLRLPASVLFAKGAYTLSPDGERAIGVIAGSMAAVLPCYTFPRRANGCDGSPHSIDAIFVEGHTDSDAMSGGGLVRDNLDLSVMRATNTFRAMRLAQPGLLTMRGSREAGARPVLGMSGYGDMRPVPGNIGSDEAAKARNRRIDLRFLMETPRDENVAAMLTGGG